MDEIDGKEPGERLRRIEAAANAGEEDDEFGGISPTDAQPRDAQPVRTAPQANTQQGEATPQDKPEPRSGREPAGRPPRKGVGPRQEEEQPASLPEKKPGYKPNWGPPFWTVTGILSLSVNAVLIAVLLILLNMSGMVQGTTDSLGNQILGGLYENFDKMDHATIHATVIVDDKIPLNISVPVNTTTQIKLAEAVEIPNANVQINTGGLIIDSQAKVTLPAETPLTVTLNFELPVKADIPIKLEVPVNIPVKNTELHAPLTGLKEVVKPYYCGVAPEGAINLDGELVCSKDNTP